MANIELVIKISESRYRLLQKQARTSLGREKLDEFGEAVLNGTSLPKGHGRLIDADVYKWDNRDIIDCEIDHPKYQVTLEELIDEASTIIEADKREEQNDSTCD